MQRYRLRDVSPLAAERAAGGFFVPAGVIVTPQPGIEPEDILTPSQIAKLLGIPAATVRSWIRRYEVESLGMIGRWPVYDYREIAAIDAALNRKAAA